MYCTNCGKENEDGAKFCGFCGAPLSKGKETPEGTPREEISREKKPKRRKGKKVLLVVILLLIVAAATAVSVVMLILPKQREKRYNAEIGDASRYLEELDYGKAEDSYLAAIDIEPKEEEPYLKLAEIYQEQNEPEKAVEILAKGVENTGSAAVEEKYGMYTYTEEVLAPEDGTAQEGDFVCEYIRTSWYVTLDPVHSVRGVLTSRIRDFDNDGEEELLVLVMKNDLRENQHLEYDQNFVYLQMYEMENGEMVLTDEFTELGPVLGGGDSEMSGVFLHENQGTTYICGGLSQSYYMYADGISYRSFVLTYEDGQFVRKAGPEEMLAGSEFSGMEQDANEMADYLESIGLVNEAARMRQTWIQRFEFLDDVEMLIHITGENDNSGDIEMFMETMDPSYLGKVPLTLEIDGERVTSDVTKEDSVSESSAEVTSDVYRSAYEPLLDRAYEDYREHFSEYLTYFLYDMDKDGVKELLLKTGTCEADYMYEIYTAENGRSVFLGEISGFHSAFYQDETGGSQDYIIQVQGHMGVETICHVRLRDKRPEVEEISTRELSAEEGYYSNAYPLEGAYITDKSLLQ